MWIKMFGAAGLFFAAWATGKRLSDSLRVRSESLSAFDAALVMLEAEMSYAANSIDRAFLNISKAVPLGGFFEAVAARVQKTGAREAWRQAITESKRRLCLTDEDVQLLSRLSAELGVSNTDNQLKSIRYSRSLLKKVEEEAERRYKTLSGLYRKLCLGGAAMLLILFM